MGSLYGNTQKCMLFLLILTRKRLWNQPLVLNHSRRASVFLVQEHLWAFFNYGRSSRQKRTRQVQEAQVTGSLLAEALSPFPLKDPFLPEPAEDGRGRHAGPTWGHAAHESSSYWRREGCRPQALSCCSSHTSAQLREGSLGSHLAPPHAPVRPAAGLPSPFISSSVNASISQHPLPRQLGGLMGIRAFDEHLVPGERSQMGAAGEERPRTL